LKGKRELKQRKWIDKTIIIKRKQTANSYDLEHHQSISKTYLKLINVISEGEMFWERKCEQNLTKLFLGEIKNLWNENEKMEVLKKNGKARQCHRINVTASNRQ